MIDLFHVAKAATEAVAESQHTGIAGMFGLDWKLFIAQLVNFGIVVFVLWKWVFTPVTKALTARTERIEKSLRDATNIEAQKEQFEKWREKASAEARSQASKIVAEAEDAAEAAKQEILKETRVEQEKIINAGKAQMEQEKDNLVQSAKLEVATLVVTAVEKILKEKLDLKKDVDLVKSKLKDVLK